MRSREIQKRSSRVNELYGGHHTQQAAVETAQLSLLVAYQRDLLPFLQFRHESHLTKLIVIGAQCLTYWPESLRRHLSEDIELLYECTAHDVQFLEKVVRDGLLPVKLESAIEYLKRNGTSEYKKRKACRDQARSRLRDLLRRPR